MATVVLGIGTSHSPSLHSSVQVWLSTKGLELDKRRLASAKERGGVGLGDFEELSRQKAGWIGEEITPEKVAMRHAACQRAITMLKDKIERVSPDVLVVIGEDHKEVFSSDHMPAMDIYWGDSMTVLPLRGLPSGQGSDDARAATGEPASGKSMASHVYPGCPDLGRHIVERLVHDGFDTSHTNALQDGISISNSFEFLCRRMMSSKIPLVPIHINTYYPPNQPTVKRCYALGKTLRQAIESWESDTRVAIVGSGGLSHMVINEEFDRDFLSAMQNRDAAKLTSFPEEIFVDGTSETKAWVVLGGAMENDNREMEMIDYVPCYRTTAGTGCAMAFAHWS